MLVDRILTGKSVCTVIRVSEASEQNFRFSKHMLAGLHIITPYNGFSLSRTTNNGERGQLQLVVVWRRTVRRAGADVDVVLMVHWRSAHCGCVRRRIAHFGREASKERVVLSERGRRSGVWSIASGHGYGIAS